MAERDYTIRIQVETREAQASMGGFFISLNQAAELAQKAFGLAQSSIEKLFQTIQRGDQVVALTSSFERLQAAAGNTGGINKLREATGGLIADFELMKAANVAQSLGLTHDQFLQLAGSAEAVADTIGGDTTEALNALIKAMGTGQDRMLQLYGITIDNQQAQAEFAAKLGISADKLSESGKRAAAQEAILRAVADRQQALGGAAENAGDAYDRFQAAVQNATDRVSAAVVQSKALTSALNSAAAVIESTDWASWGNTAAVVASSAANEAERVAQAMSLLFPNLQRIQSLLPDRPLASGKGLLTNAPLVGPLLAPLTRAAEDLLNTHIKTNVELKVQSGIIKTIDALLSTGAKSTKALSTEVKGAKGDFIDAEKAAGELTKHQEEAAQKAAEWARTVAGLDYTEIADGLEDAIAALDRTDFDAYKAQLYQASYNAFIEANRDLVSGPELTQNAARFAQQTVAPFEDRMTAANTQNAEDARAKMQQALQDATDFWTDIFSDALNGEFELDNLEDALKRAAAGAAGAFMGSLVGAPGGNITSAQGFGQLLGGLAAMTISGGGGGGGANIWAQLGTSAAPYAMEYAAGGSLMGAGAAMGSTGGVATLSTAPAGWVGAGAGAPGAVGMSTAVASAAVAAAPLIFAALGWHHWQNFQNAMEQDTDKGQALGFATTALDTVFFGLGTALNYALTPVLGGLGQDKIDALKRMNLRGWLQENTGLGDDLEFTGVNGPISLFDYSYNVGSGLAQQGVGLVQGLADIFTQGDDKLGDDLAGIFANAVAEADNFNEMLINASSLMATLGMDATQAKDELTALFLDGAVSLEEFGAGVHSFNILATEDLVGENSVLDALNVLFENVEKKPAVALHALQLLWNETSEKGVTSLEGLEQYIEETFGVEVTEQFDQLEAAGITSFENLATLGADHMFVLFNVLNALAPQFASVLGGSIAEGQQEASTAIDTLMADVQQLSTVLQDSLGTAAANAADETTRQIWRIVDEVREARDVLAEIEDTYSDGLGQGVTTGTHGNPARRRGVFPSVNRLNRAEL